MSNEINWIVHFREIFIYVGIFLSLLFYLLKHPFVLVACRGVAALLLAFLIQSIFSQGMVFSAGIGLMVTQLYLLGFFLLVDLKLKKQRGWFLIFCLVYVAHFSSQYDWVSILKSSKNFLILSQDLNFADLAILGNARFYFLKVLHFFFSPLLLIFAVLGFIFSTRNQLRSDFRNHRMMVQFLLCALICIVQSLSVPWDILLKFGIVVGYPLLSEVEKVKVLFIGVFIFLGLGSLFLKERGWVSQLFSGLFLVAMSSMVFCEGYFLFLGKNEMASSQMLVVVLFLIFSVHILLELMKPSEEGLRGNHKKGREIEISYLFVWMSFVILTLKIFLNGFFLQEWMGVYWNGSYLELLEFLMVLYLIGVLYSYRDQKMRSLKYVFHLFMISLLQSYVHYWWWPLYLDSVKK